MSQEYRPPSRLCILADQYLMANEVRTLERAVERTGVTLPLTLVNVPPIPDIHPSNEARAINELLDAATFSILVNVLEPERAWSLVYAEQKLAELFGSSVQSLRRVHVEDVPVLADSDMRDVVPETEGSWSELPEAAVELVRESCDVGIRFGFGLIRGDILHATEFGILSFYPADIRQYRGLGVPRAWLEGER